MKSTSQRPSRRGWKHALVATSALAILALSGCAANPGAGTSGTGTSGGVKLDSKLVADAQAEAKKLAGGKKIGGSISVIGGDTGSEAQLLNAFFKPFADGAGVKVNYTGSSDATSIVQSRVQAGNAPDVEMTNPGVMRSYQAKGNLLNLSYMKDEMEKSFSSSSVSTLSVDNDPYGVYLGFNNAVLWYNPEHYDGPKDGASWQDIIDWTNQNAAKGTATWCNAQGAGSGTGYPGTDFVGELFVKQFGPELSEQWANGTLRWTSPQVKQAYEMFGEAVGKDANVKGGVKGSLTEDAGQGPAGLVSSPPGCALDLWDTWTDGLIMAVNKDTKPGKNLDFMTVPPSNPAYASDEAFSADTMIAFTKTPATKLFMRYLASDAAQTLLASANHWAVSDVNVPPTTYTDPLLQKIAKTYFSGDVTIVPTPTNYANSAVLSAWYKSIVTYLSDPTQLDNALQAVQDAQDNKG